MYAPPLIHRCVKAQCTSLCALVCAFAHVLCCVGADSMSLLHAHCVYHCHAPPAVSPCSPLVNEVRLVPNHEDDDIAPPLCPHLLDPPLRVQKRLAICMQMTQNPAQHLDLLMVSTAAAAAPTCHIVDHHCHRRVPDVTGYQAAETLLARRVPAQHRGGA